jgi:hypothetical protein
MTMPKNTTILRNRILSKSAQITATAAILLYFHAITASYSLGDSARPLKIFVLAGQSNMQGHAHVRTFNAMRLNPVTAPILKQMQEPDGTPRVMEQVWISSMGSADKVRSGRLTAGFGAMNGGPKIGPEFTFGIYLQKLLDEPFLIIKTAWGGKSLHTDFRPPGSGAYEFTPQQLERFRTQGKDIAKIKREKSEATGVYYRLMIEHIQEVIANIQQIVPDYDATQRCELAGFVWFQGWNDMVDSGTYPNRGQPGGYDEYSQLLAQLIRDVRNDLSTPELPFVIGVMGVGGPTAEYGPDQKRYKSIHQNFRDAMAAPASLPEFNGNVATVLTEDYWDLEVVRLRSREKRLKPDMDRILAAAEQGNLSKEESQSAIDNFFSKKFDKRELELLKQSTSNFDFHYMGSAGIMAQIGKGFAEAMFRLLQ